MKELARIETESEVVKEGAFSDAYAVAVATEAFGVMIIRCCSGGSLTSSISVPIPFATAVPPARKNGISAPSRAPICLRSASPSPNRHKRFNANNVTAAFDDPPPKPPFAGILFCSVMSTPRFDFRASTALTIRLVSSTGIAGSSHVNTMRSSSRSSNTSSSHSETLCRTVATS